MAFFARPDLSNEQFKQLVGSELTLSGQTQIIATSGLTLSDGAGGSIILTADQAASHIGDVLTYDGAGKIKLMPSAGGSGGDPTYNPPYLSPASVNLCGITAGFVLTGKTLSCIIETLLVPTLPPALIEPSNTFNIPLSSPYEVGCVVNAVGCTTFNRGSISPQYSSASSFRSGLPTAHNYLDFNSVACCCLGTNLNCSYSMPPYTVVAGVRTASGSVSYSAGVQPKDSSGGNYSTALVAGTTTPVLCAICGVLPWYWGKSSSHVINNLCVANGNKYNLSYPANGVLPITYNSLSTEYLWFAVPQGTPIKTCWYVNGTNNGCIGGINNLFATYYMTGVTSTQGCWSNCQYMVYVSCVPSGTAVGVPMCMS